MSENGHMSENMEMEHEEFCELPEEVVFDSFRTFNKVCTFLIEENARLRAELEDTRRSMWASSRDADRLREKNSRLKEENEHLKRNKD